jgi:adenylate kinase family enzyme
MVHRVNVLGVSGSGKSTVGRALAARLAVPYVELDELHHGPNWTEATAEELRGKVEPIAAQSGWVIDGSYRAKLGSLVLERADTVVWLDLPIRVWLSRLARRTITRMVTGEELFNGNRERFRNLFERPNIFGWAWRRHFEYRRELAAEVGRHPNARLVSLRSNEQVRAFLAAVRRDEGPPEMVPGTVTRA